MISKIRRAMTAPIRRKIRANDVARKRAKEARLPETSFLDEHLENCRLLVDRRELLEQMPRDAVVAEIGVDNGYFSQEILSVTQPGVLHLIDVWHTERFHEGKFDRVMHEFAEERRTGVVRIHRKLSLDAAQDFPDNYFDWVYIDTDHSYETTRQELEYYAPKMKANGIIAGHDYVKGNWLSGHRYGVIEAVQEFCVTSGWGLIFLTAETRENPSFAIRKLGGRVHQNYVDA